MEEKMNKTLYEYIAYNNANLPICWAKDHSKEKAERNCYLELYDYMHIRGYSKKDLNKFKVIYNKDNLNLDQLITTKVNND